MAIIVDKEHKKRTIALACKDLILQNGIANLTVAQVAQAASIGKGTIYEYFANKDAIVFELVHILMQEHTKKLQDALQTKTSTKEKIREFSKFFYAQEDHDLRRIYKEFIALSLVAPQKEMLNFHAECTQSYFIWFCEILQEGIEKKELKEQAMLLAKGLFVVGDGIFIQNSVLESESTIKEDLDTFIDTIFTLLEHS